MGHDEEIGDVLSAIAFDRIKCGKCFDITTPWFASLLARVGRPACHPAVHAAAQQPSGIKRKSSASCDLDQGVVGFDRPEKIAKTEC